jgi:hypothetical protein
MNDGKLTTNMFGNVFTTGGIIEGGGGGTPEDTELGDGGGGEYTSYDAVAVFDSRFVEFT